MSDLTKVQGLRPTNESYAEVLGLRPTTAETVTKSYAGITAFQSTPTASVSTNPLYPTAHAPAAGGTTAASPNPSPNPAPTRNR